MELGIHLPGQTGPQTGCGVKDKNGGFNPLGVLCARSVRRASNPRACLSTIVTSEVTKGVVSDAGSAEV